MPTEERTAREEVEASRNLLQGLLEAPQAPEPLPPAQKELVSLELVQRTNPLYKQFRSRHYIPDRGLWSVSNCCIWSSTGMRLSVLSVVPLLYSPVRPVMSSGIYPPDKDTKTRQLNSIVNNCIFRLEYPAPNLATIVLAMWRKRIATDWKRAIRG